MNLFGKKYLKEWKSFVDHHKETILFEKGDKIFVAGEKTKGLYEIESGFVKITYKKFDGDDLLIRVASKGDLLGHRGFGGDWTYPITAFALNKTKVSFLPIDTLRTLVKTNPDFSYALMMFFAEELRNSENKISQMPVINRVASTLLENYSTFGIDADDPTKLSFTLSRTDISNMAGTTYESVVRSLAELKKKKIIQISGKSIHILDLDKLTELANPQTDKK